MKFFLYVTMTVACLVQGIKLGQLQQSAIQSEAHVEVSKSGALKAAFVDGIVDLLKDMDEHNYTSINETNFVVNAKRIMTEVYVKKIQEETTDMWLEAFAHLDKNGDGSLDKGEIEGALFGLVDKDHSGGISKKELKSLIKIYAKHLGLTLKEGWWEDNVLPGFKLVDADASGEVTLEEIYAYLNEHGYHVHNLKEFI